MDWRGDAFSLAGPSGSAPPAVASAAWFGSGGGAHAGNGESTGASPFVLLVTPVHLVAGMTHVRLGPNGIQPIDGSEARDLAGDFNRVMGGDGVRLQAGSLGGLFCLWDQPILATTYDPKAAMDQDLWDFLPVGRDGARLRRLMSEIELWLFDHPVNLARAVRGLPAISSLWLWGGGPSISELPVFHGWSAGDDPLFGVYATRSEYPTGESRGSCESTSGVVVLDTAPGAAAWADAERRWLRPAVIALKRGRLSRLTLSAANRRFAIRSASLWRFWRRGRPWWEYFE